MGQAVLKTDVVDDIDSELENDFDHSHLVSPWLDFLHCTYFGHRMIRTSRWMVKWRPPPQNAVTSF